MTLRIDTPVPTNIVTGFLGAGKTTAIRSLLRRKPAGARWAVLVNEFGEIGIDAGLIGGRDEVFIHELPGGCMCCAAGLPMQVALHRLLARARPGRLLIEPTGLGHPKEVVATLRQKAYAGVVDLRAVVTLVDARKVDDPRYTGHATFRQQLEVADVIVASKSDLYTGDEVERLKAFLDEMGLAATPIHVVSGGAVEPDWIDAPHEGDVVDRRLKAEPSPLLDATVANGSSPPTEGYLCKTREKDGFHSIGWLFAPGYCFDPDRLMLLFGGIDAERIKAVVKTPGGVAGFNMADGVLTRLALADIDDSRIEIITRRPLDRAALERALLDAAESCQAGGGA